MTNTPNLSLPYLAAAQAQKHVTVNEALMIVTGLFSACATVSSKPVIGVCPPVVEYDAGF